MAGITSVLYVSLVCVIWIVRVHSHSLFVFGTCVCVVSTGDSQKRYSYSRKSHISLHLSFVGKKRSVLARTEVFHQRHRWRATAAASFPSTRKTTCTMPITTA